MNIVELVDKAHSNAVSKGWWKEQRTYGELIALVHSEVSESLEDIRTGKQPNEVWYEFKNWDGRILNSDLNKITIYNPHTDEHYRSLGKPCGVPSELADVCIRIFDIAGKCGWGKELALKYAVITIFEDFEKDSIAEKLAWIHYELAESFVNFKRWNDETKAVAHLANAIAEVVKISLMFEIDIDQAIAEKMAYNATRSERHGGKVL